MALCPGRSQQCVWRISAPIPHISSLPFQDYLKCVTSVAWRPLHPQFCPQVSLPISLLFQDHFLRINLLTAKFCVPETSMGTMESFPPVSPLRSLTFLLTAASSPSINCPKLVHSGLSQPPIVAIIQNCLFQDYHTSQNKNAFPTTQHTPVLKMESRPCLNCCTFLSNHHDLVPTLT